MRWVAFFFIINSLWDALAASVPSPAFMGAARLKKAGGRTRQLWSDKQRETTSGTRSGPSSCFSSNLPDNEKGF